MLSLRTKNSLLGATAGWLVFLYGCAPQRPYRAPLPPTSTTPALRTPQSTAPIPAPPPPEPLDTSRRPVPQEGKIREQDISTKSPTPPPAGKESKESSRQASIGESHTTPESTVFQPTAPALPDDSSLLAKITPGVTPQRAASLRLTDEGRKLLDVGDAAKALTRLERTIAIDSTNPYGYFYLAKAQNRLGRYKESLNFLDVAESRLNGEPFWLAEVHALRGDNYRALGQPQRAETSYVQSLRLNSGNRTAADALLRLQADAQSPTK
jgi:predicted negative regulator of RcsB-dependent stress response